MAFGHGLHGLRENLSEIDKKKTCGRRFLHWLHGLKIKVQNFHLGGLSQAVKNIFILTSICGILTRTSRTCRKSFRDCYKKKHVVVAFRIDFTDLRQKCYNFHLGGLLQAVRFFSFSQIHMWHFDKDFMDSEKKFWKLVLKKPVVDAFSIDFTDLI